MKWGLRLQLLVLLGALLLVFYVPLYLATSTYTRVGLEQLQRANATKLGRSVAAHLNVLRTRSDEETFLNSARAQIEKESVHALSLVRNEDQPLAILGEVELLRGVSRQSDFGKQREVRELATPKGPAILVFEPGPGGGVAAVVRVDAEVTQAEALARIMGLYMLVGGVALLGAAYFALTRWIVRPVLELERGAERVVSGNLRLQPIHQAPRELANLSRQLSRMTDRIAQEEKSLHAKIEELEATTAELRDAQASLVRSERLATVGRLAAGLAHEVGNPISALMGLQDLMIDGGLSEDEHRDFLTRMKKETGRIHRVLSDLLAYARPAGRREVTLKGAGSVGTAIDDVIGLLAPQGDMKEMSFERAGQNESPAVPLPQEELTQVLLNLTMNSADACEKNGHVLITTAVSADHVEIWVEDDGPGIADEVRESLFEPFVSTKEVGKGTGLGLAVTRGLVEAVGGRVEVEGSALGGAKFTVTLPRSGQADASKS